MGLTPAQAAAVIQQDLVAGNFMHHPQVTVTVDQYATQNVAVLGQVKNDRFLFPSPRRVACLT